MITIEVVTEPIPKLKKPLNKTMFALACLTVPLWAIPLCALGLFLIYKENK